MKVDNFNKPDDINDDTICHLDVVSFNRLRLLGRCEFLSFYGC